MDAHSESSGVLTRASSIPRARKDATSVKNNRQTIINVDKVAQDPSKRPICKTKSLDLHHSVVNVDEFMNGFEEEGHGSRVYPSSMAIDSFSPVDFSDDVITLQSPNSGKKVKIHDSLVYTPKPVDESLDRLFGFVAFGINPEDGSMDRLQLGDEYESWRKIHMEPTLPVHLKFEEVKYKVVVKGGKSSDGDKLLLDGITGWVHPGEVLALMGPSGGGKTTLLNLLSGRVKINSGTITYNDVPYTKTIKRRIGYVTQDDIVFPHLTVKETLTYAALLRMSSKLTRQQKEERAMDVISELGLERCQDTVIGNAIIKGISGGERKRLCIGNEILLNPSLLFLDEPTSGLDSTTSLRIVQMLHNLARAGKTVVTTIHQPSSRLFSKFDKLILLGSGSSLYFGKASEAMLYFSSVGCSPLIAMNPAEFLIDLANGNINDKSFPSDLEDEISHPSDRFHHLKDRKLSALDVHEYLVGAYRRSAKTLKNNKLEGPALMRGVEDMRGREWGITWWQQFSILLKRDLKERRHDYFSCLRVTQILVTAIVVGLLWWHSDSSSPKHVQDQAGLLFFVSIFWGYIPLFTALFKFPQERAMLAKERSVGMYKLSAYFIATNISDLLLDLALPVVFLTILYFMVGLKHSFASFSLTMMVIFGSVVASQGLGYTIGAAFLDVKKATTFASIVVMAFMLSGGFFIEKVPSFMSWIRHVSFNSHTYRLLMRIQYSACPGSVYCDFPLIKELRLHRGTMEVGAMVAMIFGYRIVAYLFLKRMKVMNSA